MGEYAGAMKGAILNVNPRCQVVDITHQVAAQDVLQASFILKNTYPYYPVGTVHIVIVDPGVGIDDELIILRVERGEIADIGRGLGERRLALHAIDG